MEEKTILSVGIDIGTTTTQLVFSSLALRNTAGPTQVPRYAITDRRIVYQSPVVFTPKIPPSGIPDSFASSLALDSVEDRIGTEALAALINGWYAEAGMDRAAVTTGAVIITGESLKTSNARAAVMDLADSLGDFVVATAGPHLESVIAGRGSGAAAMSQQAGRTVLNIDIGGGTSNYAVFRMGNVLDTACLNVGGRLVETDRSGRVTRVHAPAALILEELFGGVPQELSQDDLVRLAGRMADLVYDAAVGLSDPLGRKLLQTAPLSQDWRYDAVTISGGVGACCREPQSDYFVFGDIGPLLAESLLRHPGMASLPLTPPMATVQATVIGAGSWSLSLSGSTVWAESEAFPLRNVPVITVPLAWPDAPPDLAVYLHERAGLYDVDLTADRYALAFGAMPATYAAVRYLAEGIAAFRQKYAAHSQAPLIVALREDIGKALGMELRPLLPGGRLIVVDEVSLADGDYLDLGAPLREGGFVPLVIKSLAFSGENGS